MKIKYFCFLLFLIPISGLAQDKTEIKNHVQSATTDDREKEIRLKNYWSNLDSLFVNYDWESMNQFADRIRTQVVDLGIQKVSGGKFYYKKDFLQNRLTVDLERSINAKKSDYNLILEYQLRSKLFLRGESIKSEIRNSSNINVVLRQDY